MSNLADEVLSIVRRSGRVGVGEIQDRLDLTTETLNSVLDYLVEFGLIKLDKKKTYVTLSPVAKRFFDDSKG